MNDQTLTVVNNNSGAEVVGALRSNSSEGLMKVWAGPASRYSMLSEVILMSVCLLSMYIVTLHNITFTI